MAPNVRVGVRGPDVIPTPGTDHASLERQRKQASVQIAVDRAGERDVVYVARKRSYHLQLTSPPLFKDSDTGAMTRKAPALDCVFNNWVYLLSFDKEEDQEKGQFEKKKARIEKALGYKSDFREAAKWLEEEYAADVEALLNKVKQAPEHLKRSVMEKIGASLPTISAEDLRAAMSKRRNEATS